MGDKMGDKKIYAAIVAAMADIQPIAKGRKNQSQGFNFRGIDDVMNDLQPILAKHHIFVMPEVIEQKREERTTRSGGALTYAILTIRFHFCADDGSEVCAVVIGEGMDSGDKASNKAMAIGLKYALLQTFCIPTEDTKDPDSETHTVAPKQNQQKEYNYVDYLITNGITSADVSLLIGRDAQTITQHEAHDIAVKLKSGDIWNILKELKKDNAETVEEEALF